MKRALIAGLGILVIVVGVAAANAQAPKPASPGWERYAAPGPAKRVLCASPASTPRAVTASKGRARPQRVLRPALRHQRKRR